MARGYSAQGTTVKWLSGDGAVTEVAFTLLNPRSIVVNQSQASADVTPLSSTTGMAYVNSGVITTTVTITGVFDPTSGTNLITETYGTLTITYSDGAAWTSTDAAAATNTGAYCEEFNISGSAGGALECTVVFRLSGDVYP